MTVKIDPSFDPVPSLANRVDVSVTLPESPADTRAEKAARILFVSEETELPETLGPLQWADLQAAGFSGKPNQTLLIPGTQLVVLVAIPDDCSDDQLREAAAAGALAAKKSKNVLIDLAASSSAAELITEEAVCAAVEGALLARYTYTPLKADPGTTQLEALSVTAQAENREEALLGAGRGQVLARTANLARDLANTPPRHLNAADFARVLDRIGPGFGLQVEVFGPAELEALGLGGLLGTNAGSTEEARMVKVSYRPESASGHLGLVGKGIMYDSGGISLKPSDPMHALMKFDMTGAATTFAAMTALQDLQVKSSVTGWLMCTDNMPSGSATKLGDVLTIRGGKTVEVKNTDAEGRLVLADGLVLATEEQPRTDAIVDIATLTGAALMALGTRNAALFSNNRELAAQVEQAAAATGETVWELPLDNRYKDQLKSSVADLSNIGGRYGGAILAALFLAEFVGNRPWAHLDIAGTMHSEKDDLWRVVGSTGFGARLLAVLAQNFTPPAETEE